MPESPPPPPPEQSYGTQNYNITNNDNRQYNNITNTLNQFVQMNFGRENVDYLLNGEEETDPRYEKAKRSIQDCLDLVHFNHDHPENQTVRKLNKKSDLMEFRSENGWEQEACSTGIPKMRSNLEIKLNTKFHDKLSNPTLRELLYHNSKRGALVHDAILAKYNDLEHVNRIKCKEECDVIIQRFLKNTLPGIQKTPCVVRCLQTEINDARKKYDQTEMSLVEVAKSY